MRGPREKAERSGAFSWGASCKQLQKYVGVHRERNLAVDDRCADRVDRNLVQQIDRTVREYSVLCRERRELLPGAARPAGERAQQQGMRQVETGDGWTGRGRCAGTGWLIRIR